MAHRIEPMDIDIDSDFDNKENSIHHSNVYPRSSCTEKGYEELDVSELNMKLRYSVTPVSSPMSKSFTANCGDSITQYNDDILNANLTRSYNSTLSKLDVVNKSVKSLPLQPIAGEQIDSCTSLLRSLEPTILTDEDKITVTPINENENLEISSPSSSTTVTPDGTTPTKELSRSDGGSPIMRGLKSVLNMFRSSQSPIIPCETNDTAPIQILSPVEVTPDDSSLSSTQAVLASTPIALHKVMESTKRNSPLKEQIIFNEDLEKELLWKDETTIIFSQEKIPIHKLFYPQPVNNVTGSAKPKNLGKLDSEDDLNATVEYMDISCNDSIVKDHTLTDIRFEEQQNPSESDAEFLDCETTFTNDKSGMLDNSEIESTALIQNSVPTLNETHNLQSTHQNQSSSVTNTETSLTRRKSSDIDPLQSATGLSEYILNQEEPKYITLQSATGLSEYILNQEEPKYITTDEGSTANNITMVEEIKKMCQETNYVSSASHTPLDKEAKLLTDMYNVTLYQQGMTKIVESKSVNGSITTGSEEPVKGNVHISIPSIDGNESVIEKDKIPVGIIKQPEEIIQGTDNYNNQQLNEKLETSYYHVQSIDKDVDFIPIEHSKTFGEINSSNQNLNPNSVEASSEPISITSKYDKISNYPANISLPKEDNIALEIPSDADVFAVAINKETFNPGLESTAHVDTMPKNPLDLAHQDKNKVMCGGIDGNLAAVINMQVNESNINNIFISTNENVNDCNNDGKITETSNEINLGFKTDIDSSVQNYEGIVKDQHTELFVDSKFEEFKLNKSLQLVEQKANDDNAQSELKCLEGELVDQPTESYNGNNLSFGIHNKCLESKVRLGECIEGIIENNPTEDQQTETAYTDVTNVIMTSTLTANMSNVIGYDKTKSTLILRDHSETISTDASDESSNDYNENTTEKTIFDCNDVTTPEIISDRTEPSDIMYKLKISKEDNSEEVLIVSETTSPFVIAEDINCSDGHSLTPEEKKNLFDTKKEVATSPPISPKICSKGYNFNFDEIDNPFTTKTKIRLSPPPTSPKNEVKSQIGENVSKKDISKNMIDKKEPSPGPTQKGPTESFEKNDEKICDSFAQLAPSSKLQHSLSCEVINDVKVIDAEVLKDRNIEQSSTENKNKDHDENDATFKMECKNDDEVSAIEENKSMDSLISSNEIKQTSSSEQSTYHSAETSGENSKSKNVFNIPEIKDVNSNSFLNKSDMNESSPSIKSDNSSSMCNNNPNQEHCTIVKTPEASEDKDSGDMSSTSCSSKTDEKDITVREVHTEDEDTIEGPSFEDDDFNNVDEVPVYDDEDVDMMRFSELPSQGNDGEAESGEMFIDAEAFEFLLNQNKSNIVTDSGKESLFLKFDPLFAKRVSTDGVLSALNKAQKRRSTPRKVTDVQQMDITFEKPVPGPSTLNVTQKLNINDSVGDSTEDFNVTVSKPMMVVTPAVNPVVAPRNKSITPTSSNRRSFTFSSPAIAVIDRLLSLSGNNSLLGHDDTVAQGSREQNEAEHALTQLRELLSEKEIDVYNLRSESKELQDRLLTLESQMLTLESESEVRLKKINDLNEKLSEKTKTNRSMAAVVEEYERTIASLIAENEQDKKRHNEERLKLVKERDEQTAHLASMEVSFSDLHSKYEKSKQVILTCKANEDIYKKSIKDFEENLSKMQSNYELLKQHATSKLNHANQELEKMNRAHEAEVLKLNAMIKRKELHITSLEETLAQKTKANEELTAICDELINKVG